MKFEFFTPLIAAVFPLLIGTVWYGKFGFGKVWEMEAGFDPNKKFSMPLVFGLTYLFGLFMAAILAQVVIHQSGLNSLMVPEGGGSANPAVLEAGKNLMALVENNYRTFKHGAFHGTTVGIMFALPVVAISALFERRSWKYIWIHVGYWTVCCALMGGFICQFLGKIG